MNPQLNGPPVSVALSVLEKNTTGHSCRRPVLSPAFALGFVGRLGFSNKRCLGFSGPEIFKAKRVRIEIRCHPKLGRLEASPFGRLVCRGMKLRDYFAVLGQRDAIARGSDFRHQGRQLSFRLIKTNFLQAQRLD